MLIYNSLTRQKEEFKPIDPPNISMYVCGPTVYDYFHIGNARSFIMADVIRRYLEYKGFNVKFVMNMTDVDDKIINKSNKEKMAPSEIAEKFSQAFIEDITKLGIKKATIFPKATEHIDDIVKMIQTLVERGYAYNINGNVFYDVAKFDGYGKLSGKKIDELESGSRVEVNAEKRNPLDFALWKKAKEGEPSWDSPWGKGRPGWHIECSAMSTKHLGETIDIHAGGTDLIFPHHENEIAQSEAATSHQFVKYWIHFGFLNIHNEKMSKSLGNFSTARDVLKTYSPQTIRLFFNQTHYSGPLNFSDDLLDAAKKGLEKIQNLAGEVIARINNGADGDVIDFDFDSFYAGFEKAMDDDFNSPQAAAVIFDFVKSVNTEIAKNDSMARPIDVSFFRDVKNYLEKTAQDVLGIVSFNVEEQSDSASNEKELLELLVQLRQKAKDDKNYAYADFIRDGMSEIGYQLLDSKIGTSVKRKTT